MPLHLESPLLAAHGFRHGFSLRAGGVSQPPFDALNLARSVGDAPQHVAENHRRFAASVGYHGDSLVEVSQVHGATVRQVDEETLPSAMRQVEADALVSRAAGKTLGIRVADCVAVLLADPETGAVAAVHAGWRGTVAGIVTHASEALQRAYGSPPSRLLAALFPHIGVASFEVGPEVAAQVEACAPGAGAVQHGSPKPHVDLAVALTSQLQRLGLASAHIDRVAGCTYLEPERFFSFRRDGQASGRHLAVIVPRC